jgi:hypothetical protein
MTPKNNNKLDAIRRGREIMLTYRETPRATGDMSLDMLHMMYDIIAFSKYERIDIETILKSALSASERI